MFITCTSVFNLSIGQELKEMLSGLQGIESEQAQIETQLTGLQGRVNTEVPLLEAKQNAAQAEADKIFAEHNNKHIQGSSEHLYWDGKYRTAIDNVRRYASEIKKINDSYIEAWNKANEISRKRMQKAQEIIDFLVRKNAPCASSLTANATYEQLSHCGQVDFDGQKKDRPLLDESNIKRGTNFFGIDDGAVLDESDPASRQAKMEKIKKLLTTVPPKRAIIVPPPVSLNGKEGNLTEQAKEFINSIMQRFNTKKEPAVNAVRG